VSRREEPVGGDEAAPAPADALAGEQGVGQARAAICAECAGGTGPLILKGP
jgi:hypothetical protein